MLSSSAAQESRHRMGGFNLACAAVEALYSAEVLTFSCPFILIASAETRRH